MSKLDVLGVGNVVDGVGRIIDDLWTTDEERSAITLQERALEAGLIRGQLAVNQAEAQHASVFVAGWRPFIGWVGGISLAYQFVLYPLLGWLWRLAQANGWLGSAVDMPPEISSEALWVILSGMLGLAGMRSFDKLKGTDTREIALGAGQQTGNATNASVHPAQQPWNQP